MTFENDLVVEPYTSPSWSLGVQEQENDGYTMRMLLDEVTAIRERTRRQDGSYDELIIDKLVWDNQEVIKSGLNDPLQAGSALELLEELIDPTRSEHLTHLSFELMGENLEKITGLAESHNPLLHEAIASLGTRLYFNHNDRGMPRESKELGKKLLDVLLDGEGYGAVTQKLIALYGRRAAPEERTNYANSLDKEYYWLYELMIGNKEILRNKASNGTTAEKMNSLSMILITYDLTRRFYDLAQHGGSIDELRKMLASDQLIPDVAHNLIEKFPHKAGTYFAYAYQFFDHQAGAQKMEPWVDGMFDRLSPAGKASLTAELMASEQSHLLFYGKRAFEKWKEQFGIQESAGTFLDNWKRGAQSHEITEDGDQGILLSPQERHKKVAGIIKINLEAMEMLEKERGSIVQKLNEEFGIFHFARYPKEVLIRQFDTIDENSSYVLAVYATDDWNEVFYTNKQILFQFFGELDSPKSGNPKSNLRIFEMSPHKPAHVLLKKCRKKYGLAEAGLLSAHGSEFNLMFYNDVNQNKRFWITNKLTAASLYRFRRPYSLVKSGGDVVIQSCSTGKRLRNGAVNFARSLAHFLQVRVFAPETDTSLQSLRPLINNQGKVRLKCNFNQGRTMVYDARKMPIKEMVQ